MKILDDLISTLNMDASTRNICQGLHHTAVFTRHCGLASTLMKDALKDEHASEREPGTLFRKSPQELVKMSYTENILDAAIGMAAINSLLEVDEEKCRVLNARELLLERGPDSRVAIVGHFPFIPQISQKVSKCWVIEKNPQEGDYTEDATKTIIPQANVVGLTGTAFTNHTIESILSLCSPGTYVVVIGDTAPLSPVLFDYGIDAISGTKVIDAELAIRCVSEGATYRQIKGIRQLTMTRDTWQKHYK